MKWLAALLLVVACKSDSKQDSNRRPDPPRPAADAAIVLDPECESSVKALEPWLEAFHLEVASHEVDVGSKLHVIDRPASPVDQKVDNATITAKAIQIWDASEANRIDNEVEPAKLVERLTATRANTEEVYDKGPDDLLRIDADAAAPWGNIAAVFDAARTAGYKRVVFAFTATSKLEAPPNVEPRTTTRASVDEASKEIATLQKVCKPWGSAVLNHKYGPTKVDNAKSVAKETATALLQCNCAAKPDEVKRLLWQRDRWHQAVPRVGVTLEFGDTAIEKPKATPWSEAAGAIVRADGTAVKLVAK